MTPQPLGAPQRVPVSLILIAAIFAVSGLLHFVRPAMFVSIVPRWLPAPTALVLISGVCEIVGAIGVLVPATRVAAGWALIALLFAVFPANIQMLQDAHARHASDVWQAALVARLPLQVMLIYWVYRSAVRVGR